MEQGTLRFRLILVPYLIFWGFVLALLVRRYGGRTSRARWSEVESFTAVPTGANVYVAAVLKTGRRLKTHGLGGYSPTSRNVLAASATLDSAHRNSTAT
jgi:hypothetical protein